MHFFKVRSLILRSFLVTCSFLIPSTIRSRMRLLRKQSQKLQVFAKVFNSATKLSTVSVGSLSLLLPYCHLFSGDFRDFQKIAKLKARENLFLTFFIVFFMLITYFLPNRKTSPAKYARSIFAQFSKFPRK